MKRKWMYAWITVLMTALLAMPVSASDTAKILTDAIVDLLAGSKTAVEAESEGMPEETISEMAEREIAGAEALRGPRQEKDFYNLLIIGSDRRDSSWNGNSDTIILITIYHKQQKIFMVSFMRDLGVEIPGYGLHKINYSYAVAGASKLIETLISNFNITIDHYVAVDWEAMIDIVDAFGGVDIEVKDYEVNSINSGVDGYCNMHGLSASYHYVYGSGLQHMDGIAALAYSRIRYVGNNDYERTERQRNVLTNLLRHAELSDPEALITLATELLAETDHDLTPLDLIGLIPLCSALKNYELVTDRVPYDGMFYSQNEMLIPSQPATNERLLTEIYGTMSD